MKTVTAKFGNMRKDVEWVVYPHTDSNLIMMQSEHRCVIINVAEQNGMLSQNIANYPRFLHCNPAMGGTAVAVSLEVIEVAQNAKPKSGDEIGPGVVVA